MLSVVKWLPRTKSLSNGNGSWATRWKIVLLFMSFNYDNNKPTKIYTLPFLSLFLTFLFHFTCLFCLPACPRWGSAWGTHNNLQKVIKTGMRDNFIVRDHKKYFYGNQEWQFFKEERNWCHKITLKTLYLLLLLIFDSIYSFLMTQCHPHTSAIPFPACLTTHLHPIDLSS